MDARIAGRYACALLMVAGCADTNMPSGANPSGNDSAGTGSSLSVSGRGAAAGTRGPTGEGGGGTQAAGPGEATTCEARSQEAGKRLNAALEGAEQGCSVTADCELISIDTDCGYRCGALVSQRGKPSVQAAIAALNSGVCGDFEAADCSKGFPPPCVPPSPFHCAAGVCRDGEGDGDPVDAGAGDSDSAVTDAGVLLDAGTPVQGCIDRTISWGPNGGFVAYQDRYTLEPCNVFRAEREGRRDPGAAASCENEVSSAAAVTLGRVEAAVQGAAVQAALAEAPVLYGVDTRPVDGSVFRIEVSGGAIELGSPCTSSGSGCRMIPLGLTALRELLESLTEQQLALDGCEALR